MAYLLSLHLIFLFILLLPFTIVAQSGGVVTRGSSISAKEEASPWLSPSGDFAFGFYKLDNNLFLLSIWYEKIPVKTIVWYANEGNPVPVGSTVLLTDKGLQLNSPQGAQLWISEPLSGGVASGYMNDTGNFAIIDGNSQESWGSFSFPTDTLLPLQMIARGGSLVSRKSEMNFSSGRFSLSLLDNGNLVLSTLNLPSSYINSPYYTSGTGDDVNSSNSGYQLVFNESGYLYVLRASGGKFMLSQQKIVSAGDFYYRVTLDFDGVLVQYYHPKNATANETWSVLWSEPDNICMSIREDAGRGICGYNSLCRLVTGGRKTPKCECPQGYSLLDSNDPYGGCKPNFALSCDSESLYDIVELSNTDWPISDYQLLRPFEKEDCRNSCLQDCLCPVAIFRGESCWKKKLPLANGRTDSGEASTAFIKIGKNNSLPPNGSAPTLEPTKVSMYITCSG